MYADSTSFFYQYLEIFDRGIYRFLPSKVVPVIADCGANIGTGTLYFKKCFPEATIFAFEPDTGIFKILEKNVTTHGLTNVHLFCKGVWTEESEMSFFGDDADGGHLVKASVQITNDIPLKKVKTIRLRDFLLAENVTFLKLDIEGAEEEVIEDCASVLNGLEAIFIEYHSGVQREQGLDRILNILKKNGFRYYIESATIFTKNPFINRTTLNDYDNLLNIFAYRQ
jgi:FkbM family methyltransferase